MTAKRVFNIVVLMLLAGASLYFIFMEISFQQQEKDFNQMRLWGWTVYRINHGAITKCSGSGITDGDIELDPQGRIWVSGGCTFDGIHVFDGTQWVSYTQENSGLDFDGYGDIAIDGQGHIRAVQWTGGGWVEFDGEKWSVHTDDDHGIRRAKSRFYDDQGRLWIWKKKDFSGEINIYHPDKSLWLNLTSENSGLEASNPLMGILVDDLDRLWVVDGEGVRMIPVEKLKTISWREVNNRRLATKTRVDTMGYYWFFPAVLIFVGLAVILNVLPGVLLIAVAGIAANYMWMGAPLHLNSYGYYQLSPSIPAIFCGMIGGLIGGLAGAHLDKKSKNFTRILLGVVMALIGSAFGLFLGIFFWAATNP